MPFFDNWRVQLASIRSLNDETERDLAALEKEYSVADTDRQQEIFEVYLDQVNRVQANLAPCFTTTTGTVFPLMWIQSCQLYPELKVINDNHTRHTQ